MKQAAAGRWAPSLLLILILAHFLTDFTQGAIPVLGAFLRESQGWSYAQVGTLMLVGSVASAVLQPLAGIYSDRTRNGWMMPLGLFLAGGGLAGAGHTVTYEWMLVFVAVSGAGVAVFHPDAMRAAFFLAGRRATGMALFQVGGNAGFGLSPAFAAFGLARFGMAGLLLTAVPAILWSFYVARRLDRFRTAWQKAQQSRQDSVAAAGVDRWGVQALVLAVVSIRSAFQLTLVAFIPLYYRDVLGGPVEHVGLLLSTYLVFGALGTLAGGPIADRVGLKTFLVTAMAVLVPLHWGMLNSTAWMMVMFLALQGALVVSTFAITTVMSQNYLPNNLALAGGLNVGIGIGAGGMATGLAGLLADQVGLVPVLTGIAVLPGLAAILSVFLPAADPVTRRTAAHVR